MTDGDQTNGNNMENLRTEYAAIASFYGSLVSFRLTFLGFFITGTVLLINDQWPITTQLSCLGIFIILILWLFDIRTRILTHNLALRGVYIEKDKWENTSNDNDAVKTGFFIGQYPSYFSNKTYHETHDVKVLFSKRLAHWLNKTKLASYSAALDLLYLGILIIFVASIVCSCAKQNNEASSASLQPSPPTITIPTQTDIPSEMQTPDVMETSTPEATLEQTPDP